MKYLLLVTILFITACVHYETSPQENYTAYNPEEDLKLLEQAKEQSKNITETFEQKDKTQAVPEQNCKEVLQQIRTLTQTAIQCNTHNDCSLATISFGCIGHDLPVNKKAMQSATPLFKYVDEHCAVQECNYKEESTSVACINYKCRKVARTG